MTRNLFALLLETGRMLFRGRRRKPQPAAPAGLCLEALEERNLLSAAAGRPDVLEPAALLEIDDAFQRHTSVRQQSAALFVEPFGLNAPDAGPSAPAQAPTTNVFSQAARVSREPFETLLPPMERHDVLTQVAFWTAQERTVGGESLEPATDHAWSPFLVPVSVAVGVYFARAESRRKNTQERPQTLASV
jgi:hypothetical protein